VSTNVPAELAQFLRERLPHHRLESVRPLGPDAGATDSTGKAVGYGVPLRLHLVDERSGQPRDLVLHFASPDVFGHDRRADRADALLLAYDTFGQIPHQARALDVGVVEASGRLRSLRAAGEFWLLTDWAPGHVYADDLRRIAATGVATEDDIARVEALARCLVEVHARVPADPSVYRRAIRDLVGHGEGIFGLVDSYPDDVPGVPRARLEHLETLAVVWRRGLRDSHHRLRRTHGDFHPFNVVFDETGTLHLLDASRGGRGDPADDVTCMAINFVFFALGARASWKDGLGVLWRRFWRTYLAGTGDLQLTEVAAPFLAWRALVLCHPRWYPDVAAEVRTQLLDLVEDALLSPRFRPERAEALFA
jgi:hypothetical protein